MKFIVCFCVLFLFGCSSDDSCKNYFLVIESNEKEASLKCKGLANSYPSVYETISMSSLGCLTEKELVQAKKGESTVTQQLCTGVIVTVRTKIK